MKYDYDFIFETRENAENTLSKLLYIADTYGSATLCDLDELCGLSSTYDHTKRFWTTTMIRGANILRVRDGWTIELPEPMCKPPESAKVRYRSYNNPYVKPTPKTPAEPLNIVIHTNDVDSPDETLADVFKYIYTIKDRMVNLSIM